MLSSLPDAFPELVDASLRLTQLSDSDIPALHRYLSMPAVYELTSADPATLQTVGAAVSYHREAFVAREAIRWAIRPAGETAAVGTCGLFNFDERNGRAEIGYDLSPDWWGRGLMTRAANLVVSYGFSSLGLERIEATVLAGNERSLRVLTRLGFRSEGVLRGFKKVRGTRADFLMLGRLRDDE